MRIAHVTGSQDLENTMQEKQGSMRHGYNSYTTSVTRAYGHYISTHYAVSDANSMSDRGFLTMPWKEEVMGGYAPAKLFYQKHTKSDRRNKTDYE